MKVIIVLSALMAVAVAQNRFVNRQPTFRQPQQQVLGRRTAQFIPITRQASAVNPDGSYQYQYETANGIRAGEQGVGGEAVQGTIQYTSPEGIPVSYRYTADENGFHVQGSHVPKTPDHVLKSLEFIRTHPNQEDQDGRRRVPVSQLRAQQRIPSARRVISRPF